MCISHFSFLFHQPSMVKLLLLFSLLILATVNAQDSFEDFEAVFEEDPLIPVVVEQNSVVSDSTTIEEHTDHDNSYDWDEFEGLDEDLLEVLPAAVQDIKEEEPETSKKETKEAAPEAKKKFDWRNKDWSLEIIYAVIIVIYLLNMVYGSYKNGTIAKKWLKEYLSLYQDNFVLVGHGDDLIVKESNSEYTLKTTGRIHCTGSLSEVSVRNHHFQINFNIFPIILTPDKLKSRHDLLSLLLGFFSPSKDVVTITIPLNEKDMTNLPFVFAIVSSSCRSSFVKDHKDLQIAVKKSASLPSNLECYTDISELTSTLLQAEIMSVIKENADLIEWIYVTDIHSEFVHSNVLQLRFKIPSDVKKLEKLMKLTFLLIDFIPSITLSKLALASAQKVRKKLANLALKETNQQRQEISMVKKEEEKKEKMAKMKPEELEKYKRQLEKKRQRKLMSKQSKKIVSM